MGDLVYFKYTDHCTRCHQAFADDAVMFMEHETIVYQLLGEGEYAFPITDVQTVPVCESCLSVKEQAETRHEVACLGCGHCMSLGNNWRVTVCSDRCAQRVRRASRRTKSITCTVCKTVFETARTDAKFCSGPCRQWSYRLRQKVMGKTQD